LLGMGEGLLQDVSGVWGPGHRYRYRLHNSVGIKGPCDWCDTRTGGGICHNMLHLCTMDDTHGPLHASQVHPVAISERGMTKGTQGQSLAHPCMLMTALF
jgi:hypothetical protein